MLSKCAKILFVLLLLLVAVQSASAQFYRQKDSVARIVKQTILHKRLALSVNNHTDKAASNKAAKKKHSKKSARKQPKSKAVKDSSKIAGRKGKIEYTGRRYRLGERIIMRGDSGSDVKSLAKILVKKLFLDENSIIYTADGGVLYEGEIVRAVKLFQKVQGIFDNGVVGETTLKALRRRK